MVMPARWRRVQVFNDCGATVNVTIRERAWKLETSGALTYQTERAVFTAQSVANGVYQSEAALIENTLGNEGFGLHYDILVNAPSGTPNGDVIVFIQFNNDNQVSINLSDGRGIPKRVFVDAAATDFSDQLTV